MDPIESTSRSVLNFIIVIGILLDLVCIKWRKCSNAIIYYECLTRVVVSLIPNVTSAEYTDVTLLQLSILIFILFYCDEGLQLVMNNLLLAWHLIFCYHISYNRPMPPSAIMR